MRTLLVTLCFLTLSAVQVKADISVKSYRTRMASDDIAIEIVRIYINGLGDGIVMANFWASRQNAALFCAPDKLSLGTENFKNIIDREIQTLSATLTPADLEKLPIGGVLVMGLQETFPCKGK